jgi:putative endonuclease
MDNRSKIKGEYGENVVLGYLKAKGYEVKAQNYKGGGGEIDLIAQDGEYTVFIEVKYRRSKTYGEGLEAINHAKRRRLIKAAKHYLYHKNEWDTPCRFDAIEVFGHELLEITHIKDAFQS